METNQIKAMDTNHFSSYSPLQLEGLGEAKHPYVAPAIEVVKPAGERVMITVSPGVGSNYNGGEIEAPKRDLNIEFRDVWEE